MAIACTSNTSAAAQLGVASMNISKYCWVELHWQSPSWISLQKSTHLPREQNRVRFAIRLDRSRLAVSRRITELSGPTDARDDESVDGIRHSEHRK